MANVLFDTDEEIEPATWDEMRERVVQSSIYLPNNASPEAQRAELYSQSMALHRAFIDEGIRVAQLRALGSMTPEAWSLIEPLSSIATDIMFSLALPRLPFDAEERAKLTPDQVRRIFRVTHPTPARDLVAEAQKGEQAQIDKVGFHDAVGRYLESEFRIPYADRVLLTASFDIEITAYLKEIFAKDIFTRQSVASVMDRAPIVTWLIGRVWALLRLIIVTTAVIGATRMGWISEVTAFWTLLVALGLMTAGTIVSFFGYLSFRQRWKSMRPSLVDLPRAMIDFYSEMHSEGPLSVRRVRQQAQRLADMGTVWPGGVWALLDDMEARGVVSMPS
ncbi:MAG: hypothetical protein U1E06_23495 [Tabrizicola sp.]|nr:hypothetical protein [Tabrizicola sp.]